MKVLVAQWYVTLCDTTDCSQPGFSVHGIRQARVLEWVSIPFSRGSSWPRNWTRISCIAGRFFTIWATKPSIFSFLETFLEGQPQGPLSTEGCFLGLGHSTHSCVATRLRWVCFQRPTINIHGTWFYCSGGWSGFQPCGISDLPSPALAGEFWCHLGSPDYKIDLAKVD